MCCGRSYPGTILSSSGHQSGGTSYKENHEGSREIGKIFL